LRNSIDVEMCIHMRCVDNALCPIDDRQGPETEKIKLDQAYRFNVILVELRDDLRAAVFAIQRSEVGQSPGRDHHTAGVFSGVACQALE